MKFSQLPMGARFEFEGKTYVKTSPIAASGEGGGQRLIPRYALLKPLDAPTGPEPRRSRSLDEAKVMAAFDAFATRCSQLMDQTASDTAQRALLRAELATVRQAFLDDLA